MKRFNFYFTSILIFAVMLLIGSTFAENVGFIFDGNNGGSIWWDQAVVNWDDPQASVYACLYMTVLDDDGNDAAYLSVVVGRYYFGKWVWPNDNEIDAVEYYAEACVYPGGWQGMANTWVQVPGKRDQQRHRIGHQHHHSALATTSNKRDVGGINDGNGNRKATASARAWLGGINGHVRIDVSEF